MILDTGSPWLWVMSHDCKDCPQHANKFYESQSSSFYFWDVVLDIHYGSGSIYGYNSIDQICPKQYICGDNYSFITVLYQDGLRGMMWD